MLFGPRPFDGVSSDFEQVVSLPSSEMCRKTSLRVIFCGLCGLHDEKHSDADTIYYLCVMLRDLLCVYMMKAKDNPEPLQGSLFESPLIYILVNILHLIFKSLTSMRHLCIQNKHVSYRIFKSILNTFGKEDSWLLHDVKPCIAHVSHNEDPQGSIQLKMKTRFWLLIVSLTAVSGACRVVWFPLK